MKQIISFLLVLLTLACVISCDNAEIPKDTVEDFEFYCLDTGKSDCMLLLLDGMTFLIDAADEDDYDNAIFNALSSVGAIDCFIITHYDDDHIGSAGKIIRNYDVKRIIAPSYEKSSSLYIDFSSAALSRGIKIDKITENVTITTEKGSKLVIYPPLKDYGDDNNNSIITAVYSGGLSMLLMGDAEKARIADFNSICYEHFDIVKLPHHGDFYKPLKTFFANAEPSICIVTPENTSEVDPDLIKLTEKYGSKTYYSCNGKIKIIYKDGKINLEQ